ncbi:hypothetical protein ACFQ3S_12910 [Mucilaginibacter terrae]|uniref:hypothetical protein n=1 Tax=Mucilaginibacter terrae TaxID=1955052 RepID=UPI0036424AB9
MKNLNLISLLIIVLLSAFAIVDDIDPIVGKWENVRNFQGAPMTLMADFKANGTLNGFINKKLFGSGTYKVKHDTMYFYDPTCNINYGGTYKIQYFGKDSLKFHVIQDTCTGRREGTNNFLYVRVKTTSK